MSKYDSRRYDEILVKQQYGDPFVASYGKENDQVPAGISGAKKRAAAKAAKAEAKAIAKAEAKAAKTRAKAEAKAKSEAEEKEYPSISINANSPVSMKNRRGRVHATNNVRRRQSVTLRKGFSLNGPPKEKKNMTFIERKIADMLKNENHEEKNANGWSL